MNEQKAQEIYLIVILTVGLLLAVLTIGVNV